MIACKVAPTKVRRIIIIIGCKRYDMYHQHITWYTMYQSQYFYWKTQHAKFSFNMHSLVKIYKHLNNGNPEPFRTLYCIFVCYPDGDIFSSKHMGRFCHILESFFNLIHSKVSKWGIACCRHDISDRVLTDEYQYKDILCTRTQPSPFCLP